MRRRTKASRDEAAEPINVSMRIRPLTYTERGQLESVHVESNSSLQVEEKIFSCNTVFGPLSTQQEVFEGSGIRSLLLSSVKGYTATMFAYGPTGCGKTHTVLGSPKPVSEEGLVPRSIREMFELGRSLPNRDIKLRVSCLEVYRESILDLMVPNSRRSALLCREHPKYGFFVDGLELVKAQDVEATLQVVAKALGGRHTGTHKMNQRSSRSHCMLTVHIDSLPRLPLEETGSPSEATVTPLPTYGSMAFVDLAGSERPKETGSSGTTLREAGHINRSLYVLGKVISAIMTKSRRKHTAVPFRDSVLTKLLIGSLGGTSKTAMMGCISPAASLLHETKRTLAFASQVASIKNRPVVQLDPREKLIEELRCEIQRLRDENQQLRDRMERIQTAPTPLTSGSMSGSYDHTASPTESADLQEQGQGSRLPAATNSLPLVPMRLAQTQPAPVAAQAGDPLQLPDLGGGASATLTESLLPLPPSSLEENEEEMQARALEAMLFDQLELQFMPPPVTTGPSRKSLSFSVVEAPSENKPAGAPGASWQMRWEKELRAMEQGHISEPTQPSQGQARPPRRTDKKKRNVTRKKGGKHSLVPSEKVHSKAAAVPGRGSSYDACRNTDDLSWSREAKKREMAMLVQDIRMRNHRGGFLF